MAAPVEIELPKNEWTMIVNNSVNASWQNATQWPVYIAFTDSNTAPANSDVGFIYTINEKVMKTPLSDLSYVAGAAYVWAKPIGGKHGKIIVEVT